MNRAIWNLIKLAIAFLFVEFARDSVKGMFHETSLFYDCSRKYITVIKSQKRQKKNTTLSCLHRLLTLQGEFITMEPTQEKTAPNVSSSLFQKKKLTETCRNSLRNVTEDGKREENLPFYR